MHEKPALLACRKCETVFPSTIRSRSCPRCGAGARHRKVALGPEEFAAALEEKVRRAAREHGYVRFAESVRLDSPEGVERALTLLRIVFGPKVRKVSFWI